MKLKNFLLVIIVIITAFSDLTFAQNYNWITPNKTYLKLYIADDGIYRISKSDFTNAGINTNNIDPRTVKIYNLGEQKPVYFRGESDGFFNDSDYVDFYGSRNYGGLSNVYNADNQVMFTTNEWYDLNSDTNVYWIEWGGANGLRMVNSSYNAPVNYQQNYSEQILHLEKDKIYWIGQATNANDFSNFSNERYLGESWYWNLLYNGQTLSDTFSLPLLNRNSVNVSLRIFAYPQSASFTVPNEHNVEIKINGIIVTNFLRNDFNRIDTTITFPANLLSDSTVNTATATYTSSGGFSGTMFFDLFEFKYPQKLKFRNNFAKMKLIGEDTTSRKIKVSGLNPGNQTFIYDVSNNIRIATYTNSADTLIFSARQNSSIEITNKFITKKPLRIIQRQVPDLVSSSNGVDYLIIYPKIFESQVLQLQNHRETYDNFRVKKAEIQDIYDIFSYGIVSPDAIKNFNRHIFYNWQQPRVKYVCLFGRGSLDPKKSSDATIYSENFIPIKGNPSSDNFYSNVNTGTFVFYNQISIGRLPALNVTEAQSMVNNIISYETQPPRSWSKDFTFIGGGVNQVEQELFNPQIIDSLINPHILPNPIKGNPVRIMRYDLNGALTFNITDSVKNQINRGTIAVNFLGHAGSQDWEISMKDPNVLNNNGNFPVVFSMTCYTGKTGEPKFRSFGEKFMNMDNRGAVAFFATSGWGFVYAGSWMNANIYRAFAKDTIRRIGDIISYANNVIKADSLGFTIRHTVNCYTLMGDPALKLQLPEQPEFSISSDDYLLSKKNPSINEPVNLKFYPKNFGLNSDSVRVEMSINRNNQKYFYKENVLYDFSSNDTLSYDFKLDSKGQYQVKFIIDNFNYYPDENKNNNTLIFDLNINNISFVPYKPVINSVIKNDSVEYVGLNPFIKKNEKSITLLLQTDTTDKFNSPIKQIFVNNAPQGVVTKFKTLLPVRDTSKLYFWRTNSIVNGDSSGWSAVQMFKYNPLFTSLNANEKDGENILDTSTAVYKINSQQFPSYELNNVSYNTENNSSGLKINDFNGDLVVRSLGSSGSEASHFSVLGNSIHIDAGGNTGLNLLKVRKLDGKILQHKNFKLTFGNSNDSIINFLNTFDTTHYLMGLNAAYVANTFLLNANTIAKFAQFGSTKLNNTNVRIGFFDSWSFIGYLGAQQSDVSENFSKYVSVWTESISSQNKKFKQTSGTVIFNAGPARQWQNFSWNNVLLPSNKILFDVYGLKADGKSDLLLQNISTNNNTNISSINSILYPNLNFVGKFSIDTITGNKSPVLNSFKLNYKSPAEIIAELDGLWKSDSVAVSGKEVKVGFKIYNAGDLYIPGYVAKIYYLKDFNNVLIKTDTLNNPININGNISHESKFKIPNLRYNISNNETFFIEILPRGNLNEAFTYNNFVYFDMLPGQQNSAAGLDIFSDGREIQSGDNVSLNPEVKIIVKNDPDLSNSDLFTDLKEIYLNGISINSKSTADRNSDRILKSENSLTKKISFSNELKFTPDLNKGENLLKIITGNKDGSFDTTDFVLNVTDELSIGDLTNYPNPMKSETSFMFDVTGFENPGKGLIKIYTIAGRLIREIEIPVNIGFNTITWDGKDSDGDLIANGTYLYKLSVTGSIQLESEVMKLVVLK